MKISAKVKSLKKRITSTKQTGVGNDQQNTPYEVSLHPVEKVEAYGKTFFVGLTDDKITPLPAEKLQQLTIEKELFDFMSIHSKETFIITIEENNSKYIITEVELIYG